MAENESVEMVEEIAEEVEEIVGDVPATAEKSGLLGQTPSMWFLIDSAVVLLIVLIMRFTAG